MSVNTERLQAEFFAQYGSTPQLFSAPGRVNLIGEHTDYNDGFVLPMAIDRRTYVAAALNDSPRLRVRSLNVGAEIAELDWSRSSSERYGGWLDYVYGTARTLRDRGFAIPGSDLLIHSDVPAGAGLSASAALELSIGLALVTLGGSAAPDRVQLALAGQAAEHQYVGTLCGIMDQYIAALGEADTALLIDCRTLEPRRVPLRLGQARVLVCDTRVKHQLSTSGYNQRRAEATRGCELLGRWLPGVRALRDVSRADFERWAEQLPDVERRRCRHVITENERTLAAAEALSNGDLSALGRFMTESHVSLRDDYEVSCAELDVAVETALSRPQVYGARMTGGGFGGCTVTLLAADAERDVSSAIQAAFAARGWREPELFASRACEGARHEPTPRA